ncbi:hypothetical protein EV182_000822 [Spiromyces aspiralis]|uniref:Uncharacterized protein n=1 Tax=Spiromyces aspiralis TaxID=68401 RepID=A0ACC1HUM5_9FUNG|nr:hypothetical protein EV182_000822 [Spiromyces aspiralis]
MACHFAPSINPLNTAQPLQETTTLDLTAITDKEKAACREFFVGKHNKTPERYIKIRNHIVNEWNRVKPKYLTKIAVRPGLKDCGDVNAIGRVHSFLEQLGVINVGTGKLPAPKRRPAPRPRPSSAALAGAAMTTAVSSPRREASWFSETDLGKAFGPRKRRVRDEFGQWIDEKDLEGRVISHEVIVRTDQDNGAKRKRRKAQDMMDDEWNDFTLIPCRSYTELYPAPFRVEIDSEALLLADLHSHMASTEIIGLLGGTYDATNRALRVTAVFPCNSISTTIQCEMDPASEIEAREEFSKQQLQVVGWYHSHPTFEPNPSVRDIVNQSSYQELCRLEGGVEPFIGVIFTPFDDHAHSLVSPYRVISVNRSPGRPDQHGTPYSCMKHVIHPETISTDLLDKARTIIAKYQDHPHRTDFTAMYGKSEPVSKLEKLISAIQAHLVCVPDVDVAKFTDEIRKLLGPVSAGVLIAASGETSKDQDIDNGEDKGHQSATTSGYALPLEAATETATSGTQTTSKGGEEGNTASAATATLPDKRSLALAKVPLPQG